MKETLFSRFWSKVLKSESCWLWLGSKNSFGYGHLRVSGRLKKAHRIAYEMEHGEIAAGLDLHHLCENKSCVRPSHLMPLSRRDHILSDSRPSIVSKYFKDMTHCKRGHEFTPENTGRYKNTRGYIGRRCKQCAREYLANWRMS